VSLSVKGIDGVGVVNQITNVISQELNVNMERILIEAYDGIFEGTIRLRVHDVDDIKVICDNLKKINNVRSVVRVDG
jgi:GTP pyrophosphokinase